jgi:hypothetical protein
MTMKAIKLVALFTLITLVAAIPVLAHHAFTAEFDVNKPIKFTGKMKKWDMVNPHSWFYIDVTEADGKVTTWAVEGGSPNTLIRMGVTKNTIKIDTELTVEGYRSKDGGNKAVGRNFILANGARLFLGGSAPGQPGGAGQ